MALTASGIGSNLDINSIVSGLMQVEARPLTVLASKEASFQAKLSAYGTIKSALSTFQTALRALNDPSKFQALKTSSSDTDVASVSTTSIASAGTYAVDISKVAQSQKLVAAGQSSLTAAIGTGTSTTITFDFGTISGGTFTAYDPEAGTGGTYSGSTFASNGSGVKSITIDASNNSLSGIRDAINGADMGVTATIINDGGTSPYRLVISSDNSGKTNSLKVSVSGEAAISSLLANDPAGTQNLKETITAQNTELTVNGVFVSKASQSLTDVIHGVTLTALEVGTTNISVTKDTAAATTSVTSFVKAYNDLNKTLKDLSAYNAETKVAAVLQGDSAVRTIRTQLRSLMGQGLAYAGAYTNLSQVGLTFQLDGTLALDSSKLQTALNADQSAVAAVFAATGLTSDSLVGYVSSTSKTQAGSYSLSVSQLATQGTLVGSAAAGLTITADVDDALSLTVDGVTTSITLEAKTYATAAELASEIQSKINGATANTSAGISVTVTEAAGVLTITSNRYGSASKVAVSGIGATNAFGATPVLDDGKDAAGTLNGTDASGSGQNLTGGTGSLGEGLKLLISGGALGSRGKVTFSQGYAYQLDKLVDSFLGSNGILTSRTDGVNTSIKDIESRRVTLTRRLETIEARYRKQFVSLDTLISSMNRTSSFLQQQLANLPTIGGR
jgi:flagellar hook-associated protein 2